MRPLFAFAILMLGLNCAAPEPEYASFLAYHFRAADGSSLPSLVEIESSTGRSDRLTVAQLQPRAVPIEILKPRAIDPALTLASAGADFVPDAIVHAAIGSNGSDGDTDHGAPLSLDDLCGALFASAQDNDLPIPFFANLLWQESHLKDDAVSKRGAMGIAQFMPRVAVETGLEDPFDPLQAIPASARFLRTLRLQFGNLGFVAAAYNAGAHRVAEWLEHRRSLPRETRNYVARVTGLPADAWRKIPIDDVALTFVNRLPCRSLPAFASLEQEQAEQAQAEQAKLAQALAASPSDATPRHAADRRQARAHGRHEARRAVHDRRIGKREAAQHPRAAHEKRKSA